MQKSRSHYTFKYRGNYNSYRFVEEGDDTGDYQVNNVPSDHFGSALCFQGSSSSDHAWGQEGGQGPAGPTGSALLSYSILPGTNSLQMH